MGSTLVVLEYPRPNATGRVLHTMEACPERLALSKGSFDLFDVSPSDLGRLKMQNTVCPTCQHLDVASSADRVRFLLAGIVKKAG